MPDDDMRPEQTTGAQDDQMQAAVIHRLLAECPETLVVSELIHEFTQGREKPRFEETDAIERAVADLVGSGILHREHDTIRPTRAIRRFYFLTTEY